MARDAVAIYSPAQPEGLRSVCGVRVRKPRRLVRATLYGASLYHRVTNCGGQRPARVLMTPVFPDLDGEASFGWRAVWAVDE